MWGMLTFSILFFFFFFLGRGFYDVGLGLRVGFWEIDEWMDQGDVKVRNSRWKMGMKEGGRKDFGYGSSVR